ncbi:hypothetical protein [Sphingomonas abaci]|uniref:Sulfur globule protein n=1 Tax=Sphingomonas abaci TaxID=237611 RepID=A0A7W7EWH6_9SPHN|nr:hypothetical protein [Sphingomonas abaci]MBB4616547.1 hypothetical protein [Sphingomonas abaci]
MKIAALIGAGLLATGTLAALPAEAQRWDHRGPGWDRGPGWERGPGRHYGHGYGWRDDRGPRWQGGHRWDRGPRWAHGRDRGRLICERGYYGRQCYRVYR